ncbi:hypothetical protein [Methanofollis tationis]|uniref:Uncharacterized protein n=1 Tax=Methanofollis tationis TaxID=81417 RepID=A0A7K4HNY8_9EURY|nr:hypothetical protein [Methanofollis tationis]NVO66984.1 hypothetical protein [Methanofollis tationis]
MPGSSREEGSIDLKGYRKEKTIDVSGEASLLLTAGSFVLFFVSAAAVLLENFEQPHLTQSTL